MELAKLATTKCPCLALVPGMEKSKLWTEPTAACSTSASEPIHAVSSKHAAIIARLYPTSITAVTAWFYSTFLATHSTKPATVSESTRPTILPAQPIPNPNHKPPLPLHNADFQNYPAYNINPISIQEIQLRSGRILNKNQPKTKTAPKVIIEEHEDEPVDNLSPEIPLQDVIIPKQKGSESQPSTQPQVPKEPLPKRLLIERPVIQSEFDIMTELKNVCVKIPLLQAIKDVPIYAKTIKELCIKRPGRKQKDPPTIHLVGQLSNYISETPKIVKYSNPGNPIVSVTINDVSIGNTLVDLGATINIMTNNTVELLQLDQFLRPTPTVLELADKTTIKPAGVLDDILVTLASWEYPVDFMIIHSKDPTKRPSNHPRETLAGHSQCFHRMSRWRHVHFKWHFFTKTYLVPTCSTYYRRIVLVNLSLF
jgi:hypothetical protein